MMREIHVGIRLRFEDGREMSANNIVTVAYSDSIDHPGPTARLTLANGVAPPDLGAGGELWAAAREGAPPEEGDYRPILRGRVVSWDATNRTVEMYSQAEYIQSLWIEEELLVPQGSLEDQINYLLSQAGVNETVYAPEPSGMVLPEYTQSIQPVWDAIQALAALRGFVLRYVWHPDLGEWRLTLYDPRGAGAHEVGLNPGNILAWSQLSRDLADVRNVIEVQYGAVGYRNIVTAEDPASVDAYGRRWARIVEASDSPISTYAEAQRLADAVLFDLAYPVADVGLQTVYLPYVRVHDTARVEPDGHILTEVYTGGVVEVQHTLGRDSAHTKLRLRGSAPVGYHRYWLSREGGRRGQPRPDVNRVPTPPQRWDTGMPSLTLVSTPRGISASWVPQTHPDYSHTEVFVSTSSSVGSDDLLDRITGSSLVITHLPNGSPLIAGNTYYVKIRHVSKDGRAGSYSYIESAVAGLVTRADVPDDAFRSNTRAEDHYPQSAIATSTSEWDFLWFDSYYVPDGAYGFWYMVFAEVQLLTDSTNVSKLMGKLRLRAKLELTEWESHIITFGLDPRPPMNSDGITKFRTVIPIRVATGPGHFAEGGYWSMVLEGQVVEAGTTLELLTVMTTGSSQT